ncbi:hypothetical protein EDB84DRAFT_1447035 [Lactarius hengduanensis]|nr:hypothetical protein EDB84DRAFT_1447035 [Lactarius hengduanensis]
MRASVRENIRRPYVPYLHSLAPVASASSFLQATTASVRTARTSRETSAPAPVGVDVADTTPALTRASNKPEILGIAGEAVLATTGFDKGRDVSGAWICCAEFVYVRVWAIGY